MMTDEQRLLRALLRSNFSSFIQKCFHTVSPGDAYKHSWHIDSFAFHLGLCRTGIIKRLIVTVPPRHMKSICFSVAFPAFILGHDPSAKIICASYGSELSEKMARDTRRVMESPWYRELFPETRICAERSAAYDFETTQNGSRFSTSVGGTLTGRGGRYIIIDDPMKADAAMSPTQRKTVTTWYDGVIPTRTDDKTSDCIIVVMQRLHMEDLVGHLRRKGGDWTILNLPAVAEADELIPTGPSRYYWRKAGELLHPEREPQRVLNELRTSMGSFNFEAQYQQCPIPEEGAIFKMSWFKTYDTKPHFDPYNGDRMVQSWDTASKAGPQNDYSVCTTWLIKDRKYYLFDIFRARLDYPALRAAIDAQATRYWGVEVLIEDAGSGTVLLQEIRRHRIAQIVATIGAKPEKDKVTRAQTSSLMIESGFVYLPKKAPWLDDLRDELLQFPCGAHDDQVDSISQFLNRERNRGRNCVRFGRVEGI